MAKKHKVFILAAARTAIGKIDGQFNDVSAIELGAAVMQRCIFQGKICRDDISEVIMGQVLCAGLGQNPARQAASKAGISVQVTGHTINQLAGSSLKAIIVGFQALQYGAARTIICGGQENCSQSHHSGPIRANFPYIYLVDNTLQDIFMDPVEKIHITSHIDNLAKIHSVSRLLQDKLTINSHRTATLANKIVANRNELVAIKKPSTQEIVRNDENIQPNVTLEELAQIQTCFKPTETYFPTVTSGNSAPMGDGAAALLLCNEVRMHNTALTSVGEIVGCAQIAVEASKFGHAPALAIEKLLKKIGWRINDVDLFEISETYAVETLLAIRKFNLNPAKVNVRGGALALGNTIGALGAQMMVSLLNSLKERERMKGVVSVGCGDGSGMAMAVTVIGVTTDSDDD